VSVGEFSGVHTAARQQELSLLALPPRVRMSQVRPHRPIMGRDMDMAQ